MNATIARVLLRILAVPMSIMLIVGIGFSMRNAKVDAHDASDITVKIVGKTQYHDPDYPKYIGGCYCIDLEYEITNDTQATLTYTTVITDVMNEDGEVVLTITSGFTSSDGLELAPGESVTLTTSLNERLLEENAGFKVLYQENLDDLTFTYKIDGAIFSDGYIATIE